MLAISVTAAIAAPTNHITPAEPRTQGFFQPHALALHSQDAHKPQKALSGCLLFTLQLSSSILNCLWTGEKGTCLKSAPHHEWQGTALSIHPVRKEPRPHVMRQN